ncbi:hypothetical protein DCMDOH_13805 [Klebsiella pneumoniae]|uniref:hypothetical protein n=1 Tax=Klebsiella pneumoniae TaxID=573 RepID=UPI003A4CC80B|nr:hypothetical protein [Klebsiella pneumoniae]
MTTIKSAGFVAVQEGYAIFGTGSTSTEALENAKEWADDVSSLKTHPATQQLINEVEKNGGQIVWGYVDGVACTEAEEE